MGGRETQPEKSYTTTNTSYRLQFEDYIGKDNGSLTDSYKPLIGWEAHQLHLNDRRQNNKHRPELQHALLIFIHVSLQKNRGGVNESGIKHWREKMTKRLEQWIRQRIIMQTWVGGEKGRRTPLNTWEHGSICCFCCFCCSAFCICYDCTVI